MNFSVNHHHRHSSKVPFPLSLTAATAVALCVNLIKIGESIVVIAESNRNRLIRVKLESNGRKTGNSFSV